MAEAVSAWAASGSGITNARRIVKGNAIEFKLDSVGVIGSINPDGAGDGGVQINFPSAEAVFAKVTADIVDVLFTATSITCTTLHATTIRTTNLTATTAGITTGNIATVAATTVNATAILAAAMLGGVSTLVTANMSHALTNTTVHVVCLAGGANSASVTFWAPTTSGEFVLLFNTADVAESVTAYRGVNAVGIAVAQDRAALYVVAAGAWSQVPGLFTTSLT